MKCAPLMSETYAARGVAAAKTDVHAALQAVRKQPAAGSVFPEFGAGAFAAAVSQFLPRADAAEAEPLFLMHSDGCGSKAALAYLYWRETGELSGFRHIAQDALVMNTDDLLAVGAAERFIFTSTIARHKRRIPGEIVRELMLANHAFTEYLSEYNIAARVVAGETADLGETVRTLTVDVTAATWLPRVDFIDAARVRAGAVIVGLASAGQASYEPEYNSGIGANGLSAARHDLLKHSYLSAYPESVDDSTAEQYLYNGDYAISDALAGTPLTVGQSLLSPTRSYLPVMKTFFKKLKTRAGAAAMDTQPIQAIFHLTGGGQTKCLRFGKGIHYVKDRLFSLPPIFKLLAERTPMRELLQVYNCGHRLEVILTREADARLLIDIAANFNIDAQLVGYTEANTAGETHNTLSIDCKTATGKAERYHYQL